MATDLELVDYDLEHPWTRQPCDDERAWRAFVSYRDGVRPRSLLDVARATGEPLRDVKRWQTELGWDDRVLAYDRWADLTRSAQVAAIIGEDAAERAARHIMLLRGMQEVVGATVRDWMRRVSVGEVVVDQPRDVIRAIKEMVTLERLVSGETTAHQHLELNSAAEPVDARTVLRDRLAKLSGLK